MEQERTLRYRGSFCLYPEKGSSTLKPFMYLKYSYMKPNSENFIASADNLFHCFWKLNNGKLVLLFNLYFLRSNESVFP